MWEYLSICIKLLLYPAYHSTDFDVHRNWLSITSNLPVKQWYFEDTNQWTLDYPPFFAYFEYFLSLFVPQIVKNDGCLEIVPKGQYGWPTVIFQRSTVVLTEFLLLASLKHLVKSNYNLTSGQKKTVQYLIWLSPAWIILDHIHFQYNAMMYGLFIFSINCAMNKQFLRCAALFSTLLCFKHIYLYLAPAYFAFLLGAYIVPPVAKGWRRIEWLNAIKLGIVTLAPFIIAFGPFYDQMDQVLSRLFPFSRGLTHAYWAPNFWALYSFADRVLGFARGNAAISTTRGIVGQVQFSNLGNVSPRATFLLTLFYQLLAIIPNIVSPTTDGFLRSLTLCGFASFLFGWHVHEKAILLVVVPFTLFALQSRKLTYAYLMVMSAGCICLVPLIFTPQECIFKYTYTGLYLFVATWCLPDIASFKASNVGRFRFALQRIVFAYIAGFALVIPLCALLVKLLPTFEFLELMLLSVYCSLGVIASWIALCTDYFSVKMISGGK